MVLLTKSYCILLYILKISRSPEVKLLPPLRHVLQICPLLEASLLPGDTALLDYLILLLERRLQTGMLKRSVS